MMASQRVGAGEGNRTLDIQLGKLDSSESFQRDSCKTWPAPGLDDTWLSESCLPLELHRA
jgi:hypothetical protein